MSARSRVAVLAAALAAGLVLVHPAPAEAATPTTFTTTDPPVDLPDGGPTSEDAPGAPVSQNIVVSGLDTEVDHLSVSLTIDHTYAGDLILTVTSPTGTTADLARSSGASGTDVHGTYVFTDDAATAFGPAATALSDDQTLPSGSYRASTAPGVFDPQTEVSLDDAFAGIDPNGTWIVTAQDRFGQDLGTLTSSAITFSDTPDTTGPVATIDSGPDDGAAVETAPSYGFSSADTDVDHFECSVDGTTFSTCTSPFTPSVEPGTYIFSVRGVDTSDNTGAAVSRSFTLRDVACEDATTTFYDAKSDVRTAKDKLAAARESGNPKRVERAKERLAAAKAAKDDAKDDAVEACGTKPPPPG